MLQHVYNPVDWFLWSEVVLKSPSNAKTNLSSYLLGIVSY
ncbi:hypothetical protein P4H65_23115 [Paenibacillus chitinolyticus]|nr:hypothetical protein [Paenibacillus chitinolyticus]